MIGNTLVELHPGQLVTGRSQLAAYVGLTERSVRTCLNLLKSTNRVTSKTTNKYSIISITNYERYQGLNFENDQQNDQQSDQQIQSDQQNDQQKQYNLFNDFTVLPNQKFCERPANRPTNNQDKRKKEIEKEEIEKERKYSKKEKDKEEKDKEKKKTFALFSPNQLILFKKFWEAYPKKRSKGQAEKTWKKINPDEQLVEIMIFTIERAKTSDDWLQDDGKFIPHPSTWLNAKGWEDEEMPKINNSYDDWIKKRKLEDSENTKEPDIAK